MSPGCAASPLGPGDRRALAQAISAAEREEAPSGVAPSRPGKGRARAHLVGLTGPPGGGKSTLADALITAWRAQGRTVAVLAVDPSSPFTGGAVLGDRVRMQRHATDPAVFIRSMGAHGHLGGLAASARTAVRLVEAAGFERVLLETVGVGQSELEVAAVADTVVVVTTPAGGDGVQAMKAGIMEIADVFVVNKADLDGAERTVREIRGLARAGAAGSGWTAPVVASVATRATGVGELVDAIDRHHAHLAGSDELDRRRRDRLVEEVVALVARRAAATARRMVATEGLVGFDGGGVGADLGEDPVRLADRLLARVAAGAPLPGPAVAPAMGRGSGHGPARAAVPTPGGPSEGAAPP